MSGQRDKGHIRLSADNDINVSPLPPPGDGGPNTGVRIKSPTIPRMGPGDAGEQDSVKGCLMGWVDGVERDISPGVSSVP